jgi:hypothetical protein
LKNLQNSDKKITLGDQGDFFRAQRVQIWGGECLYTCAMTSVVTSINATTASTAASAEKYVSRRLARTLTEHEWPIQIYDCRNINAGPREQRWNKCVHLHHSKHQLYFNNLMSLTNLAIFVNFFQCSVYLKNAFINKK